MDCYRLPLAAAAVFDPACFAVVAVRFEAVFAVRPVVVAARFPLDAVSLAPDDTARALTRLRDTLDDHHTAPDGVVFDSRAWMITAHRR